MPEWERVRLGEVLVQDQQYIAEPESRLYPKLSVKLYGRGVVLDTPVRGDELKMKRHQIAQAGQVILSEIWGKKGAIGLVPAEGEGALCTSHFFLFNVVHERVMPEWLELIFKANYLQEQLNAGAQGTTGYAAVRPKHLLAAEIPLPPLPEQRRIVARVKAMLAKVEEARGLRTEADEAAKLAWSASAKDIFADFDASVPLAEVVTLRGGGTPSKSNPDFWNGDVPWVTPKDMKRRNIQTSQDKISAEAINDSPAKLIAPGAVLVVVRGMILAHTVPVAVLDVPATINQDMKAMVPSAPLLPEFLSAWMWAHNDTLLSLVERSTHDTRKLETPKLLATLVPVPELSEQKQALNALSRTYRTVTAIRDFQAQTQRELDALPSAILARAFAGAL